MAKKQKQQNKIEVIEEPLAISGPKTHFAVSIIPTIKNGRGVFEIVKFYFTEDGLCGDREVMHTTINESTAMTLLFQTAHETFDIKYLRQSIKKLKGDK